MMEESTVLSLIWSDERGRHGAGHEEPALAAESYLESRGLHWKCTFLYGPNAT